MSAHHYDHDTPKPETLVNLPRYRKILWIALIVNAAMFLIEMGAGVQAGSLSLLADAVDFAGDALNYAVSLAVLASALAWRARAALLKAVSMMGFGLYVLGAAVWSVWDGGGTASHDYGSGGAAGTRGQRGRGLDALRVSRRRRQHAQRVALLAQRRHRQRGGVHGRAWRFRHRFRLARSCGGQPHGGAGLTRRLDGATAGAR